MPLHLMQPLREDLPERRDGCAVHRKWDARLFCFAVKRDQCANLLADLLHRMALRRPDLVHSTSRRLLTQLEALLVIEPHHRAHVLLGPRAWLARRFRFECQLGLATVDMRDRIRE